MNINEVTLSKSSVICNAATESQTFFIREGVGRYRIHDDVYESMIQILK